MAGITPDVNEWNDVLDKLADFLTRLKQVEDFNAEMDGRQEVVESALPGQDSRVKSLESWRGSADATMNAAERTANENKAATAAVRTALEAADASIINRVKQMETWKPQADNLLQVHTGQLAALESKTNPMPGQITALQSNTSQLSARLDSALGIANRANDGLNSLTKTVQGNGTQISNLQSALGVNAAQLAQNLSMLTALTERVKALEDKLLVAEGPSEPQEPTV
jgi:chromosome segregation ATPase